MHKTLWNKRPWWLSQGKIFKNLELRKMMGNISFTSSDLFISMTQQMCRVNIHDDISLYVLYVYIDKNLCSILVYVSVRVLTGTELIGVCVYR